MTPLSYMRRFTQDETGSILVFWAFSLVVILGMLALVMDIGRLGATQSDLQSYADSASLAAAAELDGAPDAIARARASAALVTDTQKFADGGSTLDASDITLTFFAPAPSGKFERGASAETTNPHLARFVQAQVAAHRVTGGFGGIFSLSGGSDAALVSAPRAVAGFALEACNVAPVAVCLPTVDFDAATSIGDTLVLDTSVSVDLNPGRIAAIDTLTSGLEGLEICAGLLGSALDACLLASRQPETACTGQGGLRLEADISSSGVLEALDTRFDRFTGIASGFAGNPDFEGGPNVLTGLTNALGICTPVDGLLAGLLGPDEIGLPVDDCLISGGCTVQGDGAWSAGRTAYVEAHYGGNDPFPQAQTRFDFYRAEVDASVSGTLPALPSVGGLVGGLLGGGGGGFVPQMCAPQQNQDPKRRLMVVAGIDCLSANVDAAVTTPPVQQFFEVFALGPSEGGRLAVEITACLGGGCGGGNLDTDVRDIVRLVE